MRLFREQEETTTTPKGKMMNEYLNTAKEGFMQPFRMLYTVALMFVSVIFGDPLKNQYERVELAIKAKAQLISDHEFNKVMENFYITRCGAIDPHTDWWGFAEAKEKQTEYRKQLEKLHKKVLEANAFVKAQEAAFKKLQDAR